LQQMALGQGDEEEQEATGTKRVSTRGRIPELPGEKFVQKLKRSDTMERWKKTHQQQLPPDLNRNRLTTVGEGDISDTDSQRSDNEDAKSPIQMSAPIRTPGRPTQAFSPQPKPIPASTRAPVRAPQQQFQSIPQPTQTLPLPLPIPQPKLQSPVRGPAAYNLSTSLHGIVGTPVPTVPAGTRRPTSGSSSAYGTGRLGGGVYGSPYGAATAGAYLHTPSHQQTSTTSGGRVGRAPVPGGSPATRPLYEDQEEVEPSFSWFEQLRAWDIPEADAARIAEVLEAQGFEEQDISRLNREELTYLPTTIKGAHIARILDGVRRHTAVRSRK